MFNGKQIDYEAVYELLVKWGIGIYYTDKGGMRDMIIVKKNGKFVRQLSMNDVFEILKDYAQENYNQNLNDLFKSQQITQTTFYRKLPRMHIEKYRDNKNTITFFFKNAVIQITKDIVKCYDYENFDTGNYHIWESHTIDHEIDLEIAKDYQNSNWYDFCKKVVGEGIEELMQTSGYMVHNYKDPTNARIIVLADASQQSGANGGSGKTLIAYDAPYKIRRVDYIEGKKFDPERPFAFQTIDEYADLVAIDDVQKNFKYHYLYNAATNDMTIERKYASPVLLTFKKSPKFVVTTNYGIINQGGSDKRRRVVIAFGDYFNIDNTVYDEYEQEFFTDWTKKEWDQFFGFYFYAAKKYLNYGLKDFQSYNVDRKALSGIIGDEFVEYVENNLGYWLGYERRVTETQLYDNIPISLKHEDGKGKIKKNWEMIVHANNYKIQNKREPGGRFFWLEKTDDSNEYEGSEQWESDEAPF